MRWAFLSVFWALPALGAPLTLRGADRAVTLALEAELGGDFGGAQQALEALVAGAVTPDEAAGKERLVRWLEGLKARQAALGAQPTPAGWVAAFGTLAAADPGLQDRYWHKLAADNPALLARVAELKVSLVGEAQNGLNGLSWAPLTHLGQFLSARGVALGEGLEAKLRLGVVAVDEASGGHRVAVQGGFVLRDLRQKPTRTVGSAARERAEVRRKVVDARSFATRRVVDDLGRALIFQIRAEALRQWATPAALTPGSR